MFRSSEQPVCAGWIGSLGGHRRHCLFHGVQSGDTSRLRLSVRASLTEDCARADVSDDALAALPAGLRDTPFLSILPFIGGGDDGPHGHRFSAVIAKKTSTPCKLTG